jgi:hypothetical protein
VNKQQLENFIVKFNQVTLYKQQNKILNKPTFIGVGAGRCGTTSIHKYLKEHEEVYMSPVKEINYFGLRNIENNICGITFQEYLFYFLGAENKKCIGEFSPVYLSLPNSASLIKQYLSQIKIIITLRDPIARSISQCKHQFKHHKIDNVNDYLKKGIEEFVSINKEECIENFHYSTKNINWYHPTKNIINSLYFRNVNQYIQEFGKDNIFIITYDMIQK